MRRERVWTRLWNNWDVSKSCASCAQTQSWNENLELWHANSAVSFLSSLTTLAWVPTCQQAHVCMQRAATAHPLVNTFCKSKLPWCHPSPPGDPFGLKLLYIPSTTIIVRFSPKKSILASKIHVHSVNCPTKSVYTKRAFPSTICHRHSSKAGFRPILQPSWSSLLFFLFLCVLLPKYASWLLS